MFLGHFWAKSVAAKDTRISVTVTSEAHQFLLAWWADLTGRSQSNLAGSLLERAIADALKNGDVPEQAVHAMNQFIDAIGEHKAESFQEQIQLAKDTGRLTL